MADTQTGWIECLGGPLDGKLVPHKGAHVETPDHEHTYTLGLAGQVGDLRDPRREVYLYDYPEGHGW